MLLVCAVVMFLLAPFSLQKFGAFPAAAALWAMLLAGGSFLGCLISSLAGAEEWVVLFLALSAVMTACGALCFAARGDFATKKR